MYKEFNGKEVLTLSADLYIEHIFPFLSFADIAKFGQTRKILLTLSRNQSYWHAKFKLHFPHYYRYIDASQRDNINWYFAFIKATAVDYAGLDKEQQQIFILAKEGDKFQIKQYLNLGNTLLERAKLYSIAIIYQSSSSRWQLINKMTDANNLTPLNWLRLNQHQHVLDAVFQLVSQTNTNEEKIMKWALRCNQSLGDYKKLPVLKIQRIAAELGLTDIMQQNLRENIDKFNLNYLYRIKNLELRNGLRTALHIAASKGFASIIALLLEKTARHSSQMTRPITVEALRNIERGSVCTKITPLHCAVEANHFEAAVLLVRAGASPFVRDSFNNSPLEYAVANHNEIMFEFFLDELNEDNYDQMTLDRALYQAVCRGYQNFIQPLIKAGAIGISKNPVENVVDLDQRELRAKLIEDHQHRLVPDPIYWNKWLLTIGSGVLGALLGLAIRFAILSENDSSQDKSVPIGMAIGFVLGVILGYLFTLYRNSIKRDVFLVPIVADNSEKNSERIPLLNKKKQLEVPDIEQGKSFELPVKITKQHPRTELLKLLGYFKNKASQEELRQIETSFQATKIPEVTETSTLSQ